MEQKSKNSFQKQKEDADIRKMIIKLNGLLDSTKKETYTDDNIILVKKEMISLHRVYTDISQNEDYQLLEKTLQQKIERIARNARDKIVKLQESLAFIEHSEFTTEKYQTIIDEEFDTVKTLSRVPGIYFNEPLRRFEPDAIDENIREQGKNPLDCINHPDMSKVVREWTSESLKTVKGEVKETNPDMFAVPIQKQNTLKYSSFPTDDVPPNDEPSDDESSEDEPPRPPTRPQTTPPQPDLDRVFRDYLESSFTIDSELILNGTEVNLLITPRAKVFFIRNQFATECLINAIIFFETLKTTVFPHPVTNPALTSYKNDDDPDDTISMAKRNLFDIRVPYGLLKSLCFFILTGEVNNRGIIASLIEWIKDGDEDLGTIVNILTLEEICRRIGLQAEILCLILKKWVFIIPRDITGTFDPKNIKVYSGIGTSIEDANFLNFVAPLTVPGPPIIGQPIISSFMLSTAFGFDQASLFCKSDDTYFNMLEIILGPGIQLSLIAESANEAEILLKMGNVYIFKKSYKLIYQRSRPGIEGSPPEGVMNITVYQFELVDSSNTEVPSYYDQFAVPLGGSKIKKRRTNKRKTKRRRTNKRQRRTSKRRKTNKRRQRRI
jgi:hypothetical protein